MQQLANEASLDEAFGAPIFLILKHSPICPISGGARIEVENFVADHPDVPTGLIDVIEDRPLSQAVAARTGVQHESPQALLLKDGEVAWHESHWRITAPRLAEALASD